MDIVKIRENKYRQIIMGGIVFAVSMIFFLSMLHPVRYAKYFKSIQLAAVIIVICLAAIFSFLFRKSIVWKTKYNLIIVLYLIARVISLIINHADKQALSPVVYEVFFIIGLKAFFMINKKSIEIVLATLIIFDVITIFLSFYLYIYKPELFIQFSEEHPNLDLRPQNMIFYHRNTAGVMACLVIIVCFAYLIDKSTKRWVKPLLMTIMILNIFFLFQANCRSGITALLVVLFVFLVNKVFNFSIKHGVTLVLTIGIISLIPIYYLVFTSDSELTLKNNEVEQRLDQISSNRYRLWKTTILSQEGKEAFGFGTTTYGILARLEYVQQKYDMGEVSDEYSSMLYLPKKRQGPHNGYLGMVNATGFCGSLLFFGYLAIVIIGADFDSIKNKNLYYLLVAIFWINLFENHFIIANGLLCYILMLLINYLEHISSASVD